MRSCDPERTVCAVSFDPMFIEEDLIKFSPLTNNAVMVASAAMFMFFLISFNRYWKNG